MCQMIRTSRWAIAQIAFVAPRRGVQRRNSHRLIELLPRHVFLFEQRLHAYGVGLGQIQLRLGVGEAQSEGGLLAYCPLKGAAQVILLVVEASEPVELVRAVHPGFGSFRPAGKYFRMPPAEGRL